MSESQSRTSPIVVIAAISIIIFSAVGVGVMTGYIPSSISKSSEVPAAAKTEASKTETAEPTSHTEKKTQAAAQRKSAPKRAATSEPARVASAPQICNNCGKVEAVNAIQQKGEGSGLGAVAGGVIGGLLANQVGSGRGRTAATVVGAGAGAYAGNEAEKYLKKSQHYEVAVRLEDGTARTFAYQTEPAFRVGDKVKVVDGALVAD